MTPQRRHFKSTSNGQGQNNKNVCSSAVCGVLGVAHRVKYLHSIQDVMRAIRKEYETCSRVGKVKGKTVGASRVTLAKLSREEGIKFWVVRVPGHVVLLDKKGKTIVDTDPRQRDRRKITHCYGLMDLKPDGQIMKSILDSI